MDSMDKSLFTRLPDALQLSQRAIHLWHIFRSVLYLGIQIPTVNFLLQCVQKQYAFLLIVVLLYALILMRIIMHHFMTKDYTPGMDVHLGNVFFLHNRTREAFLYSMKILFLLAGFLLFLYFIKKYILGF